MSHRHQGVEGFQGLKAFVPEDTDVKSIMTFYRKLLPTDLNVYRDHLLRLSSQDRYARFCGFKTDESIAAYCRGIDWRFTIMVGCFVRGELRAVAAYGISERLGLELQAPFRVVRTRRPPRST